ncbi:shematrin-like protein 1 [Varroa jacobsoni]|uniref:shematrin-like protein 1 n=1 Tax=Varroa jacobsoni TaxID=62625 RepID=UPI000BF6615C|nr:shematrin-like protein 1 [Varroa jacobsoni]
MLASRTTAVMAYLAISVSAGGHERVGLNHKGALTHGHGGFDLGYGHGSLYGYGLGGMSYGLNYGKTTGGYRKKTVALAKPATVGYNDPVHVHGAIFGNYGLRGYGFELLGRDAGHHGSHEIYDKAVATVPISIEKDYGHSLTLGGHGFAKLSHNGGGSNGVALGHKAVAITQPVTYGGYGHRYGFALGGYGSGDLAYGCNGYGKTTAVTPPIFIGKGHGGIVLKHGAGLIGLGRGKLDEYSGKSVAIISDVVGKSYGGHGFGHDSGIVLSGHDIEHGTPVISGIVKAGVPVSFVHGQ